jgi:hypothetical protein
VLSTGVHDAGGSQPRRALLDGARSAGTRGAPFVGAHDVGGFRSVWALRACCFMARTTRSRSGPTGVLFVGAHDAGGLPSGGRRGAFDGGAEPCRTGVHGHPVTCPHTEIWRLGLRHLNYGLRHA